MSNIIHGIQETQLNDDSVTDELLILASQNFKEDQGRYLRNDDEYNERRPRTTIFGE